MQTIVDQLLGEARVELGVLHQQAIPHGTEQHIGHHHEIGIGA